METNWTKLDHRSQKYELQLSLLAVRKIRLTVSEQADGYVSRRISNMNHLEEYLLSKSV
jgi:hypothetical protein